MPIVLVVDDEPQVRELLIRWLTADGYEMREAESADAALADMQIVPADIVLCDVRMPGHDGVWLTGEIRSLFPETAVVLITGDRGVPPQVSMQSGVVDYLGKPFTRVEVVEAVQRAVHWHRHAVGQRDHTGVRAPLTKDWGGG